MSDLSINTPSERDWLLPETIPQQGCPAMFAAWNRSAKTLKSIRQQLPHIDDRVCVVAVSGSLGRMEQRQHSDCDLLILLNENVPVESPDAQEAFDSVWKKLEPLGLGRPKPTGIYATPSSQKVLCDPDTRGQVDEDVSVFGKRIQFLLDSQPVYGDKAFRETVSAIVDRYLSDQENSQDETLGKYLLDDLIRYFRSLSVMYRWEGRSRPGYWRLRNVKLRHNRLVMYAGMLLLIAEADRQTGDPAQWLKDHLPLTPLERVAFVYSRHSREDFSIIAECYERYLSRLGDEDFFAGLTDENDSSLGQHPLYREMNENSRKLSAELSRFLLDAKDESDGPFYSGLFF